MARVERLTQNAVAEWVSGATRHDLQALARNVDAKRSLFLAYTAMKSHSDEQIQDLALEVEDILRRLGSEEAASGLV